jgi:glyoxylase-like metal-dependent hydrolase (beta-lactamase superfamily II)
MPGTAGRLDAELRQQGYALSQVRSIVLTHSHFDHVGNAAEIVRLSGAPILAHRDEVPYIERTQTLPSRSLVQRLLMALEERVLPRQSPLPVSKTLEDGDVVDAAGGMRVIHTPGHTPGSICLYQAQLQVLLCGDTLFNKNPMTGKAGLRLSLPIVSSDMQQVKASVRRLATLPARVLCFGHGEPILQNAQERIKELLQAQGLQP